MTRVNNRNVLNEYNEYNEYNDDTNDLNECTPLNRGFSFTSDGSIHSIHSNTHSNTNSISNSSSGNNVNSPGDVSFSSSPSRQRPMKVDEVRFYQTDSFLCTVYAIVSYILGVQFVTAQITSTQLTFAVGHSVEDTPFLFLMESLGAFVGMILSVIVGRFFYCHTILVISMAIATTCFVILPFISKFTVLSAIFFILGISFVLTSATIQYLTRSVVGTDSGIWIAVLQTCFFGGGSLPVILYCYITEYYELYTAVAVSSFVVAVTCGFSSNPQIIQPYYEHHIVSIPHYYTEVIMGTVASLLLGAFISLTCYEVDVLEYTTTISSEKLNFELLVLWICATVGSCVGLIDELFLAQPFGLARRLSVWLLLFIIIAALVAMYSPNELFSWIEMCGLGFVFGPCLSFVLDWVYRATYLSAVSISIIMGLMFGGSLLYLYVVGIIWVNGSIATYLNWIVFATTILAYLLLPFAFKTSYIDSMNFFNFCYRSPV